LRGIEPVIATAMTTGRMMNLHQPWSPPPTGSTVPVM